MTLSSGVVTFQSSVLDLPVSRSEHYMNIFINTLDNEEGKERDLYDSVRWLFVQLITMWLLCS